jgi:23S rRNA (guanosine2251-2'-O)-methyltransferase
MQKELVYVYGKHALDEALTFRPDLVTELYVAASFKDERLLAKFERAKVAPKLLNEKRLPGGLRSDAVHQGVVAGINVAGLIRDYKSFMETLTITPDTSFLVLGEVQDPHNVGAVIRSAAACGVSAVLIPPHNQAPITGTVVKVSAGMAFRIPIIEIRNVNATLTDLKKRGCWVYGLAGEAGSVPLPQEQFDKPSVFVLGNEGEGLRLKTREACDTLVAIPMHTRCESLNAAASAAIVLYAWVSQHPGALH